MVLDSERGEMRKSPTVYKTKDYRNAWGMFWCNAHERIATHINEDGRRQCDPQLGGIMLPCSVVFAPIGFGKQKRTQ